MLTGGVCHHIFGTHLGGNRGDIDNPPTALCHHFWHKGFADVINTGEIDIEDFMPEFVGVVNQFMAVAAIPALFTNTSMPPIAAILSW